MPVQPALVLMQLAQVLMQPAQVLAQVLVQPAQVLAQVLVQLAQVPVWKPLLAQVPVQKHPPVFRSHFR